MSYTKRINIKHFIQMKLVINSGLEIILHLTKYKTFIQTCQEDLRYIINFKNVNSKSNFSKF